MLRVTYNVDVVGEGSARTRLAHDQQAAIAVPAEMRAEVDELFARIGALLAVASGLEADMDDDDRRVSLPDNTSPEEPL